jgi:hypothetical protein
MPMNLYEEKTAENEDMTTGRIGPRYHDRLCGNHLRQRRLAISCPHTNVFFVLYKRGARTAHSTQHAHTHAHKVDKQEVSIKRTVGLKKDEYFVDGKHVG